MNNFKQIEPKDTLPKHVKTETMSNLGTVKMLMDMVDLFVIKGLFVVGNSVAPPSMSENDPQPQPNGERNSD